MALLTDRLSDPACRLATLTGPGGVGKTRLALQIATALADQFADGVYWVPLTDAADETDLVLALAHALGLHLSGAQDLRAQLLQALRHDRRERLLVLDNFEQLLPEGVTLVLELLRTAPGLTPLITSRERLNLQAEVVLSLFREGTAFFQPPGTDARCGSYRSCDGSAPAAPPAGTAGGVLPPTVAVCSGARFDPGGPGLAGTCRRCGARFFAGPTSDEGLGEAAFARHDAPTAQALGAA